MKVFNYENLKDAPVGTKVTFRNGRTLMKVSNHFKNMFGMAEDYYIRGFTFKNIERVEIPTQAIKYVTIYEKKGILDKAEKKYLSNFIKPWRNKVLAICKNHIGNHDYIAIKVKENNTISLPEFHRGEMYNGMEYDKDYFLEELEL